MSGWQIIDVENAKKNWDIWLKQLGVTDLYQSFRWGQHKAVSGKPPVRFACFDETGVLQNTIQGYLKRLPFGIGMLWVPGGIAGNFSGLNPEAHVKLKTLLGLKYLLVRVCYLSKRTPELVAQIQQAGLHQAVSRLNSGLSMSLSWSGSDLSPLRGASSNWSHNLRRGLKRTIPIKLEKIDPQEIFKLYSDLEEAKGIGTQFTLKEFESIIAVFGDDLVAYGCRNEKGQLLAIRACIVSFGRAWDMWAAATSEARKNYSSHALLSSLLDECVRKSVAEYDLSGIDPKKVAGVYNFKKGTGAAHLEYLGEWDWCESGTLTILFNFMLALQSWRLRRKTLKS